MKGRTRPKTGNKGWGTLYVVSTPIGNMKDMTLRGLETLKNVDLIAAEGVKHTGILCNHYGINSALTGYNQHNRKAKTPELIDKLKKGADIALVTNAGTPGISDPGSELVNMAHQNNIKVSPVPGPSALAAALSACGLRTDRFLFMGFLSSRPGKRKREIKELINEKSTMVFYEAPHRVKAMLEDLHGILGNREATILRELTKVYEEIKHGDLDSILETLPEDKVLGEFTIAVSGADKPKKAYSMNEEIKERIRKLLADDNMGVKDAALRISRDFDLNYRAVYRECLALKRRIE